MRTPAREGSAGMACSDHDVGRALSSPRVGRLQGLHTPPARPSGQAFGMNVPRGTSRVGELPDRAPISFRAEARADRPSRTDRPPIALGGALPADRRGGRPITTGRRHGGGDDTESRPTRGWQGVGVGERGAQERAMGESGTAVCPPQRRSGRRRRAERERRGAPPRSISVGARE